MVPADVDATWVGLSNVLITHVFLLGLVEVLTLRLLCDD